VKNSQWNHRVDTPYASPVEWLHLFSLTLKITEQISCHADRFFVKKRRRECLCSILKAYFFLIFLPFSNLLEVHVVFFWSQICYFPRGL
jgi:hypothetical protein